MLVTGLKKKKEEIKNIRSETQKFLKLAGLIEWYWC